MKLGPRGVAQQPEETDWDVAAVWEIDTGNGERSRRLSVVRDSSEPSRAQARAEGTGNGILEVDYLGDCARVYVDDVPIADDFYKGLPLRCALWRIPQGKVTVRILPWSDSPLIYVEPPYRPSETGANIKAVRLVETQR